MLTRKASQKKKKKKKKIVKKLDQNKGKISFGLSRKIPKFEKYTNVKPFKLHLIPRTIHVTTKIRCSAVMVLAKL